MSKRPQPKQLDQIGNELAIVWEDGHETYLTGEQLRRACPCAMCKGHKTPFGTPKSPGAPKKLSDRARTLVGWSWVGNYGVQPAWSDGHSTGIFTFDRLRSMCTCDQCQPEATDSTSAGEDE